MKKPKLFFGFHETISLPHSNTHFLRHLKYPSVTKNPQQTSTIYIYFDIQLPGYKKVFSIKE